MSISRRLLALHLDEAMIIAVGSVRMVQVIPDQVVGVIPVRYLRMAASRSVLVLDVVPAAGVVGSALVGIALSYPYGSLVEVIPVRQVQVSIVQVSGLIPLADRCVPASRPVGVRMLLVSILAIHESLHGLRCNAPARGKWRTAGH
jgi:hypothetical protein